MSVDMWSGATIELLDIHSWLVLNADITGLTFSQGTMLSFDMMVVMILHKKTMGLLQETFL